jgi:putative drug exporter of the RND superfamily
MVRHFNRLFLVGSRFLTAPTILATIGRFATGQQQFMHFQKLRMNDMLKQAANLLLVSRMKEEIAAGINTGIIRAMAGTGKVVANAGLVFAFTMAAMVFSDLRIIGQVGTTIGLGLLFDTLVVRSFLTPSIAALLGRWFRWPQIIRPRPASRMLRDVGPRPLVRALLLREEQRDDAVTTELLRSRV